TNLAEKDIFFLSDRTQQYKRNKFDPFLPTVLTREPSSVLRQYINPNHQRKRTGNTTLDTIASELSKLMTEILASDASETAEVKANINKALELASQSVPTE